MLQCQQLCVIHLLSATLFRATLKCDCSGISTCAADLAVCTRADLGEEQPNLLQTRAISATHTRSAVETKAHTIHKHTRRNPQAYTHIHSHTQTRTLRTKGSKLSAQRTILGHCGSRCHLSVPCITAYMHKQKHLLEARYGQKEDSNLGELDDGLLSKQVARQIT